MRTDTKTIENGGEKLTEPPVDTNRLFWSHDSFLGHIERNDPSPGRWERLATDRPPAIGFEYRQSPRTMVPGSLSGRVTWRDPQFLISGMVSLDLDTEGLVLLTNDGPLTSMKNVMRQRIFRGLSTKT